MSKNAGHYQHPSEMLRRLFIFPAIGLLLLVHGCATTTGNFSRVAPESIDVVIGYHIVAKDSVHPALRNGLAFAIQMVMPMSSVAASVGNIAAGAATQITIASLGEETPLTLPEATNQLVFQRVSCMLAAKGYTATLMHTAPVNFFEEKGDITPVEEYIEYASQRYHLDQDKLSRLPGDAILFVEYILQVHMDEPPVQQPLPLASLQIDGGYSRIFSMSKPPDNLLLFGKNGSHGTTFSRSSIEDTINGMIRFQDWPVRQHASGGDVNQQCRLEEMELQ